MCLEIKSQLCQRVGEESDDTQSIISTDNESLNVVVTELRDTIHSAIEQANQVTHYKVINFCKPIKVRNSYAKCSRKDQSGYNLQKED